MNYDVLIIGSGPAGQQAAWQAARMGKRAAIIERKPKIGGAGLQTGTIPSKAMREVAYLLRHEWAQTAEDILWRRSKQGLVFSTEQKADLAAWLQANGGLG